MNIKKLIANNILTIGLFALILFFSQFLSLTTTIVLILIWAVYLIYSNYEIVFRVKDLCYELDEANKGLFDSEVALTKTQIKSMESRMEVLESLEDKDTIENVCKACENQFYTNVKYMIALMDSYDYVTKPKQQKELIQKLAVQNRTIISKLNELIEKEIMLDKSVHDTDLDSVDDLIESLKELTKETAN